MEKAENKIIFKEVVVRGKMLGFDSFTTGGVYGKLRSWYCRKREFK